MTNNLSTLVIGASEKPTRYSHIAVKRLVSHGHKVYALGLRKGNIGEISVETDWPDHLQFHTVTLYLNPTNQEQYYEKIIHLRPKRVIFNPGTENPKFYKILKENEISVEIACTLVLLNTGQYV